jgi:hypothetical protein
VVSVAIDENSVDTSFVKTSGGMAGYIALAIMLQNTGN